MKGLLNQEREVDETIAERDTEYLESLDKYDKELRIKIDEIGEETRKTEELTELNEIETILLYLSNGGWEEVDEMIQLGVGLSSFFD